ncbi:MAG: hypothetical protein Q7S28_03015 [bacterium]|nr:hypothetical protein [bacterium]
MKKGNENMGKDPVFEYKEAKEIERAIRQNEETRDALKDVELKIQKKDYTFDVADNGEITAKDASGKIVYMSAWPENAAAKESLLPEDADSFKKMLQREIMGLKDAAQLPEEILRNKAMRAFYQAEDFVEESPIKKKVAFTANFSEKTTSIPDIRHFGSPAEKNDPPPALGFLEDERGEFLKYRMLVDENMGYVMTTDKGHVIIKDKNNKEVFSSDKGSVLEMMYLGHQKRKKKATIDLVNPPQDKLASRIVHEHGIPALTTLKSVEPDTYYMPLDFMPGEAENFLKWRAVAEANKAYEVKKDPNGSITILDAKKNTVFFSERGAALEGGYEARKPEREIDAIAKERDAEIEEFFKYRSLVQLGQYTMDMTDEGLMIKDKKGNIVFASPNGTALESAYIWREKQKRDDMQYEGPGTKSH